MECCETVEEQPPEEPRQHPHGQEEAGPAGDPARAVWRQAAAGHDDVDVRMMGECRAPCMEHRGEADAGAEMFGIGGNGGERLAGGLEQEVVDDGLVLEGDRRDGCRSG
jgi:hypothetical protein